MDTERLNVAVDGVVLAVGSAERADVLRWLDADGTEADHVVREFINRHGLVWVTADSVGYAERRVCATPAVRRTGEPVPWYREQ